MAAAGQEAGPSAGPLVPAAAAEVAPAAPAQSGEVITIQIRNVVATANLGIKLDLQHLAKFARNSEFNPKRFAACIIRIRDPHPKSTALVFATGKMVVTGTKSEEEAKNAARVFAKIVDKAIEKGGKGGEGQNVKFKDFTIQNMVGTCDLKFSIRLEGLAIAHASFCQYEPEIFPGLVYRMVVPKVVILTFVNGKIVITGAKKRADIHTALSNFYPICIKFRKLPAAAAPAAAPT